jgi:hypothetical protein
MHAETGAPHTCRGAMGDADMSDLAIFSNSRALLAGCSNSSSPSPPSPPPSPSSPPSSSYSPSRCSSHLGVDRGSSSSSSDDE